MSQSPSEVSSTVDGSTFFDIVTARLAVIDQLIEDAKRMVWSYLPSVVPNTFAFEKELNLPKGVRCIESDTYQPLYGVLANKGNTTVCALRELSDSRELKTEPLLKLKLEVGLCSVYRKHLYYTTTKGAAGQVWKIPLEEGDHRRLASVVPFPDNIKQIRQACGCIFFVGSKTSNLYMMDSVTDEPKKVGELPIWECCSSEPVFQDAVVDGGSLMEILYIATGPGVLYYWRRGQGTIKSPLIYAHTCRLLNIPNRIICCGFFGPTQFHAYDIGENLVLSNCDDSFFNDNRKIVSVVVRRNWTVQVLSHSFSPTLYGQLDSVVLRHDTSKGDCDYLFDYPFLYDDEVEDDSDDEGSEHSRGFDGDYYDSEDIQRTE